MLHGEISGVENEATQQLLEEIAGTTLQQRRRSMMRALLGGVVFLGKSRQAPKSVMGTRMGFVASTQHFSGNVRELKNCIVRALALSSADEFLVEHLGLSKPLRGPQQKLESQERKAFVEALRRAKGSRGKAARYLDVARSTVYRKMVELDIREEEYLEGRDS